MSEGTLFMLVFEAILFTVACVVVYNNFISEKLKRKNGWYETDAVVATSWEERHRSRKGGSHTHYYADIVYSNENGYEFSKHGYSIGTLYESGETIPILVHPEDANKIFNVTHVPVIFKCIPLVFIVGFMIFLTLLTW
jgi:hypothetical protein